MRSLSKVPINEIMDHFVSTWKFEEGFCCKQYEYHVDTINNVIVFDMEIEGEIQPEIELRVNNAPAIHNNNTNRG